MKPPLSPQQVPLGFTTSTSTVNVSVTGLNDAPTLANTASTFTGTVLEDGVSVPIDALTLGGASDVDNGDTLTVREKKGPWYKVRTESGSTGWIYSSLVTTP